MICLLYTSVGYGNLGRGVECAVLHSQDMELTGVFTRRNPKSVKTHSDVPVYSLSLIHIYLLDRMVAKIFFKSQK